MPAIRSMTGFGAAAAGDGALAVRTEVRSVNHRYLQVKARLPLELSTLEPEIEAAVRARLERGAVTVNVNVERSAAGAGLRLDHELARRYQKELEQLASALGLHDRPTLETLIALPGVVGTTADAGLLEREQRLVQQSLEEALGALVLMREREGAAILKDLQQNARAVDELVARIGLRMPKVVQAHHEKLVLRLNELLGGQGKLQPADLPRELALLAERMDVGEELARLASHMEQWAALLAKGGAVGRQLDFLVQEMLREANTIASKCNDAEVAHGVVEIKTRIERLREQVQNVE